MTVPKNKNISQTPNLRSYLDVKGLPTNSVDFVGFIQKGKQILESDLAYSNIFDLSASTTSGTIFKKKQLQLKPVTFLILSDFYWNKY